MPPRFELFTDGACSGNPGPGGWGFILRGPGLDGELVRSDGEPDTTNNRMELTAIIRGLEAVPGENASVRVVSDSEYAIKGLREWLDNWKKKGWKNSRREAVRNTDLWLTLDALRQKHRLELEWIRGHQAHPENVRCDQLAVQAAERFAKKP